MLKAAHADVDTWWQMHEYCSNRQSRQSNRRTKNAHARSKHHPIVQIREIEQGILNWLIKHEYQSIKQMQGSPQNFERSQYMKAIQTYNSQSAIA